MMKTLLDVNDYTVGWIAPLEIEAKAALGMLDHKHDGQFKTVPGDDHLYFAGDLYGHNIIIASLGGKPYGPGTAAALASHMKARFPNLWFGLLVGVAAGLPNLHPEDPADFRDIRLGDVLVCEPSGTGSGIVYYDNIKATDGGPVLNGRLTETAAIVTSAIQMLRTNDEDTFEEGSAVSEYLKGLQQTDKKKRFMRPEIGTDKLYNTDKEDQLEKRAPRKASELTLVWYGKIGSGSTLGRSARRRDELRDAYDIIGLETEAAGVMNTIAVGVVRGVCDYADKTKNKEWQPYAAATAAAYAKALICQINPGVSETQKELEKDEKRRTENKAILNAMEEFADYERSAFDYYAESPLHGTKYSKVTIVREALEWFFGSPEYKTWFSGSTPQFLWHSGPAGSGKTITSVCTVNDLVEAETFLRYTVHIFCSQHVWPEPLTSAMLVYSLLAQIPGRSPNLLEKINEEDRLQLLHQGHSSREGILWDILRVFIDEMKEREIYIIIDGIDKISLEQRKRFLGSLCDLWRVSTKVLRILVSARPYRDIQDSLKDLPYINPDKESLDCLNSLSKKAVNTRRTNIEDGIEDTGEWIFEHGAYKVWNQHPTSSLLWIQGKAGSGKSTLLKKILQTLERSDVSNLMTSNRLVKQNYLIDGQCETRNIVIASFFYSLRQMETSHVQMLQTLLYQLLRQERRLYPVFRETYRRLRESGQGIIWEFEDLKSCFLSLARFSEFPLTVYFLIDAMDESDKVGRPEILSLLLEMRSISSSCTVKSVVASRPVEEEEIVSLPTVPLIALEKENTADIAKLITTKMAILDNALVAKTALTIIQRNEILKSAAEYLTNNAKGVFLWVDLVTQDLMKCVRIGYRPVDFSNSLDNFPKELKPFYKRMINELVSKIEEQEREETKRMFTWVTFVASPLPTEVFGEVIAILDLLNRVPKLSINDYRYSDCDAIKLRVTSSCGDLVEFRLANASREKRETVQLLHQTVRDFLLSDDASPFNMIRSLGHNIIATTCIQYLEMALDDGELKSTYEWINEDYCTFVSDLSSWPLLPYVVYFLPYHLKHLEAHRITAFTTRITVDPSKPTWCLLSTWLVYHKMTDNQHPDPEHAKKFRNKCLDIAAETGKRLVVDVLLAAGTKLSDGDYPLRVAVNKGRLEIVRLLLQNQVAEDQREDLLSIPLQIAAYNGHLSIVKMLLENGADVNAEGDPYGTAIEAAAFNGHEAVITVLLDYGADINAQGAHYGTTALQAAVIRGDEQLVKYLLSKGADFNISCGKYGTSALQAAVTLEHESVVRLLTQRGVGHPIGEPQLR